MHCYIHYSTFLAQCLYVWHWLVVRAHVLGATQNRMPSLRNNQKSELNYLAWFIEKMHFPNACIHMCNTSLVFGSESNSLIESGSTDSNLWISLWNVICSWTLYTKTLGLWGCLLFPIELYDFIWFLSSSTCSSMNTVESCVPIRLLRERNTKNHPISNVQHRHCVRTITLRKRTTRVGSFWFSARWTASWTQYDW